MARGGFNPGQQRGGRGGRGGHGGPSGRGGHGPGSNNADASVQPGKYQTHNFIRFTN